MQFPGFPPNPLSPSSTLPPYQPEAQNPIPHQILQSISVPSSASNKTFRATKRKWDEHQPSFSSKAPGTETKEQLIENKIDDFFRKMNSYLENMEKLTPQQFEQFCRAFIFVCSYFKRSNVLVFDKKFDEFLSFESLKRLPDFFQKFLIRVPNHIPLFKFSRAVPLEVIKRFVDLNYRINLSQIQENEYADYMIHCNGKVFQLYSVVLQRDFKTTDILSKLDELNDNIPFILELLLTASLSDTPTVLNALNPEQLTDYIRAAILLNYQKGLHHLAKYCSETAFNLSLLENFVEMQKNGPAPQSDLVDRLFSNAIDRQITQCLASFLNNPLSRKNHVDLLEKYGFLLKNLHIALKSGVHKNISILFPNLESLTFTKKTSDKWKTMITAATLPNLKKFHLTFVSNWVDLSLFEKMPQLEKIVITVNRKSSVAPFTRPKLMTNLRELTFHDVSDKEKERSEGILSPKALKSIASLPKLENLGLENIDLIDAFALVQILDSKTLKKINLKKCSFCFQPFKNSTLIPFKSFSYELMTLQNRFQGVEILREETKNLNKMLFLLVLKTSLRQAMEVTQENQITTLSEEDAEELVRKLSYSEVLNTHEGTANYTRNRYGNVVPYIYNSLTPKLRFYLNASPIRGIDERNRYAAQGPLPVTQGDFWSGALQVETSLIVMLTACSEGSIVKCEPYWPTNKGEVFSFIDQRSQKIHIELIEEIPIRTGLEFRNFLVRCEDTSQEQMIGHLHVTDWQDHEGRTNEQLHDLVCRIIAWENTLPNSSTLIHCSAGIGRTGLVFLCLAIEKSIQQLTQVDKVHPRKIKFNVEKALKALRVQRDGMVATSQQLISAVNYFNYRINQIASE